MWKDPRRVQSCSGKRWIFTIAIDPVDGTRLTAKGLPGAISVLAAATCDNPRDDPSHLFPAIPTYYMMKIAVGPVAAASFDPDRLDAPLCENLDRLARCLDKRVCDLVVVVLDRDRHNDIVEELRQAGCRISLISDGDVAAAIAPSLPDPAVDLYVGIGGSPEAVLAAAAVKSLGGQMLCRMYCKDEGERARVTKKDDFMASDWEKIWTVEDLAKGNHIIFAATGISNSSLLRGVRYRDHHWSRWASMRRNVRLRARINIDSVTQDHRSIVDIV